MKLGWSVLVISSTIAVTGPLVAIRSTRLYPDAAVFDWSGRQFLLIMFTEIAMYLTFVTIGVVNRKRPRIHRPMMLLAAWSFSPSHRPYSAGQFDLRASPMGGVVRTGCLSRSASAACASGHDSQARPRVRGRLCSSGRRYFGSRKTGGNRCLGQLGGNDPEAVTESNISVLPASRH